MLDTDALDVLETIGARVYLLEDAPESIRRYAGPDDVDYIVLTPNVALQVVAEFFPHACEITYDATDEGVVCVVYHA